MFVRVQMELRGGELELFETFVQMVEQRRRARYDAEMAEETARQGTGPYVIMNNHVAAEGESFMVGEGEILGVAPDAPEPEIEPAAQTEILPTVVEPQGDGIVMKVVAREITNEEIIAAVNTGVAKRGIPAVRAILDELGVQRATELPADRRAAFIGRIEEMGQ